MYIYIYIHTYTYGTVFLKRQNQVSRLGRGVSLPGEARLVGLGATIQSLGRGAVVDGTGKIPMENIPSMVILVILDSIEISYQVFPVYNDI